MTDTALSIKLRERAGHGISDEDVEAYVLGFNDALDVLLRDEVYYSKAIDASTMLWRAVEGAVKFVKEEPFEFPDQEEDEEL